MKPELKIWQLEGHSGETELADREDELVTNYFTSTILVTSGVIQGGLCPFDQHDNMTK